MAGHPVAVSLSAGRAATGYDYLTSSILRFSGGGSSDNFVGSVVCYSIDDSGGMNIHFDQSLGGSSTSDPVVPFSWTEGITH